MAPEKGNEAATAGRFNQYDTKLWMTEVVSTKIRSFSHFEGEKSSLLQPGLLLSTGVLSIKPFTETRRSTVNSLFWRCFPKLRPAGGVEVSRA